MARFYRDVDDDNYEDSEEDLREEDDDGPYDPTRSKGIFEPLEDES